MHLPVSLKQLACHKDEEDDTQKMDCYRGRRPEYFMPVSYTHLDVYKRQRNNKENV